MTTTDNAFTAMLSYIMGLCYSLVGNYGLTIIVFTFATKIALLPLSLWVHKNGIKVVKLQPKLNHLKAVYFGDADQIADKIAELYKREKYNPFASIIPLFIQLALLIGLVGVIYTPFNNIFPLSQTHIDQLVDATVMSTGADPEASSIQLTAIEAVQSGKYQEGFSGIPENVLNIIQNINLSFWGLDLAATPAQAEGMLLLVPLLAGLAALLLSLVQNKLNPLQAEQSTAGKFGTTAFSVGLSLFLGAFVPAGVGFYWIWSNLFTIVQQYLLNWMIDPKKAIDYDALKKSKQELAGLQGIGGKKKWFTHDPNAKREKSDYKRFFSIANKHLVFYSEKNGFYKYFENVMEYLLSHSNVTIHYITSDPNDSIFEKANKQPQIKPYYIGEKKLITLMMKMDADIVVMTMPDLDNYHIKRSYIKKDVEYIHMMHYPLSTHMIFTQKAFDAFNTIFCVGEFQAKEIRQTEACYQLPSKNLVVTGYGVLEKMHEDYQKIKHEQNLIPKVLIAPSWQPDNILDSCIETLLASLLGKGFLVTVRPHPEYTKRYRARMNALVESYTNYSGNDLIFELDFSKSSSIFSADVVITDWSGTAYEFAFATNKPALFINTPPKVTNANYQAIEATPLEIFLRDKIGLQLNMNELDKVPETINTLLHNRKRYEKDINQLSTQYIANLGKSGEIGAKYIINQLIAKRMKNCGNTSGRE